METTGILDPRPGIPNPPPSPTPPNPEPASLDPHHPKPLNPEPFLQRSPCNFKFQEVISDLVAPEADQAGIDL